MQKISHHEIFSKFPSDLGRIEEAFVSEFNGHLFNKILLSNENPIKPYPTIPFGNQEYFEWMDILEAVVNARDQFIMLEIGAGFGSWSGRAAVAARYRSVPFYSALIEAEPSHVEYIHKQMKINNISDQEYRLFDCAVGEEEGDILFYVNMPKSKQIAEPLSWFGQSPLQGSDKEKRSWFKSKKRYFGKEILKTQQGYNAIRVKQRTLTSIFDEIDYPLIDICHFDIQGFEFDVVNESLGYLNSRVKRMCIATHNDEVEVNLKEFLLNNNWQLVRDYSNAKENDTECGRIPFIDGVQSWLNKRLA